MQLFFMYIKRYRGWEENFDNFFSKRVPLMGSAKPILTFLTLENLTLELPERWLVPFALGIQNGAIASSDLDCL